MNVEPGRYLKYLRYCILVLVAGIQQSHADVSALLDELARNPQEFSLLHRLESEPRDPRIIPALAAAFERAADKRSKQELAKSLIVIGAESPQYFEYLAGFARAAVASDSSDPYYYDQDGRALAGKMSPELQSWALAHGLDPRAAMAQAVGEMPHDVYILAEARDQRANSIFREGRRLACLAWSRIQRRAWLGCVIVLLFHLIVAACERFHGSARTGIAWQFAMFESNVDADQALQRYIPEAKERQRLYRDAQSVWSSHRKSQARRESKPE
jgi:hypothetical protein